MKTIAAAIILAASLSMAGCATTGEHPLLSWMFGRKARQEQKVEAPGRNVAAKSGLNRSMLEQGHAETVRQLSYKAAWLGGEVCRINPAYTSQTCPCCGHVSVGNRPSRAVFRCVKCAHSGHADVIAAQNILSAGLAASARGGASGSVEAGTTSKRSRLPRRRLLKGIPVL